MSDDLTIQDYKEVLDDKKRLTREIDVALNGDNAAQQASLCDILGQIRSEGITSNQAAEIERLSRQNTDLQANNTKLVLENRRLREVINRVPVMISASIASNYNRNPYVCGQDAQRIKDMCNEALKGGCDG